jgi:leucyl/phenylalanyl-tRNA--protein transferase
MPVFLLTDALKFPPPVLAEPDGLLAVGGDLSVERLLMAYSMGIFPWYCDGDPILWWSPDPRLLLFPHEFKVSRSLNQTIRKGTFTVTFDTAFEEVINRCSAVCRKGGSGTWITGDMIRAYVSLHEAGYAHSVEARADGQLAGGLYGVALGGMFCGESMFSDRSNASKAALAGLVQKAKEWGLLFIDCQMTTPHLVSLGAQETPRKIFMELLTKALGMPATSGNWGGKKS